MKAEKKDQQMIDIMGNTVTLVYILAMFCVFPIFFTDKLFRITDDKRQCFLFFTVIYAGFMLVFTVVGIAKKRIKNIGMKATVENIFSAVFIIAIMLSTYFALDRNEAIYGTSERRLGLLVLLGCMVAYLGVQRYGKFHNITLWSMLLGSGFIYLCGILCACKVNFFYLQENALYPEIFLTPIGNINFNAAYMCLMFPTVMVMFMLCKEHFSRNVYAVILYMGCLFSFFIKTESSIICIVSMFLILAYFALEERVWFERYLQMIMIYIVSAFSIFVLLQIIPEHLFAFDGLGVILLSGKVIAAEAAVGFLIFGIFRWKGDVFRSTLLKYRRNMKNVIICIGVVGIAAFILANTIFQNKVEDTIWTKLQIVDETFNTRGYIWIRTIREFGEIPWKNKIFGCGLSCFSNFIKPHYGEEMLSMYGASFVDPHNAVLQMLINMGILGVIGYLGLILSVLYYAFRNYRENKFQIVVILTLVSYLLQGIVNSDTIHTFPLLFVFLGLTSGDMRKIQE